MVRLEDIAQAAIAGEALRVRSLAQDWLREHPRLADVGPPEASDPAVQAVAAGIVELLALRRAEPPPAWAATVPALQQPLFLLRYAAHMPHLRRLCESEAPEPLRRRRIYAPPDYLSAA